jgi:hypothetical protein
VPSCLPSVRQRRNGVVNPPAAELSLSPPVLLVDDCRIGVRPSSRDLRGHHGLCFTAQPLGRSESTMNPRSAGPVTALLVVKHGDGSLPMRRRPACSGPLRSGPLRRALARGCARTLVRDRQTSQDCRPSIALRMCKCSHRTDSTQRPRQSLSCRPADVIVTGLISLAAGPGSQVLGR